MSSWRLSSRRFALHRGIFRLRDRGGDTVRTRRYSGRDWAVRSTTVSFSRKAGCSTMTGQVAWDREGKLVGEGDCEAQMRQSFDNVEHILKAVGGRLEDIVSMTIILLDREDLPVIQKVRSERLSSETASASILVRTPGLVIPELLVELVPIAVIPFDRYHEPAGEC